METNAKIFAWGPSWGSPSIDIESTILMFISRLFNKFEVITNNITYHALFNKIPLLLHGNAVFDQNLDEILKELCKENINLDSNLTNNKLVSDSLVFYIQTALYPAIIYTFWIDSINCQECTRPAFAQYIQTPFGIYVINRLKSKYRDLLKGRYCLSSHLEVEDPKFSEMVFREAKECLDKLSARLGDNTHLLDGENPTKVDAYLYGHLAPLYYAPLKNVELKKYLLTFPNLVNYVKYYTTTYFSDDSQRNTSQHVKNNEENDEWAHKTRDKFVWGLFVTTSMAIYAFFSGIIKIKYVET